VTRVFLCGEGPNELGSRSGHPSYQTGETPGFIEASLEHVAPGRARVVGAVQWKYLPRLEVGGRANPYTGRAAAALQRAREGGAHLCLLVDADGDARVEPWVRSAVAAVPDAAATVGVPAPKLEGWIVALLGDKRTEAMSPARADARLAEHGVKPKDTEAFVEAVANCDPATLPPDAAGLRRWFAELGDALGAG
jgi:hypothetical protein